jgi:hypothetical protein
MFENETRKGHSNFSVSDFIPFKSKKMTRFFIMTAFLFTGVMTASSQATLTTITIDKKIQPGLVLQLPNNTDVAEGTILQKLKATGYTPETKGELFWKKNKIDGFYVFNGIELAALDNQKLDMYFKVEPKSKTQKDQSTIYLLVSKGYDNFISPEADSATFVAATDFLNGFVGTTATYRLNLDIEEQGKVVKNAEKKLTTLREDDRQLVRKIDALQADLRNNKNDQVMQTIEIASQKIKLEELRAKVVKL